MFFFFFFSSRRRHTRCGRDWSSDVCSSDLFLFISLHGSQGAITMWYAIISEDVPNSLSKRQSVRPAHVERLKQLKVEGRLLVAGPHPAIDSEEPGDAGFSGSLVIAEFASLTEAQAWADADPYIEAGVYQQVIVKPYLKVLP